MSDTENSRAGYAEEWVLRSDGSVCSPALDRLGLSRLGPAQERETDPEAGA